MEKQKHKMIDLSYLELTFGGNTAVINKVLQSFVDSTPNDLLDLEAYGNTEQWSDVKGVAHKVKTSFNTIGAKEVGEILLSIEIAASSEDTSQIQESIRKAKELGTLVINQVIDEINNKYGV